MVCAKPETRPEVDACRSCDESAALKACLVEGDASQRARERALRRRSLIFSVVAQLTILAALILVPIMSKTERIAMANVMPLPPYRPATAPAGEIRHILRHTPQTHGFQFCLRCAAVAPRLNARPENPTLEVDSAGLISGLKGGIIQNCPECVGIAVGNGPPPVALPDATPKKIVLTHIDPAMLVHRVEPVFPVLARQVRREGTVELHAIIAADGSVQSLEVLQGDSWFFQSALEAVRQWRYRPTVLNGRPVEVDTHITVIYKLAR